MKTLIIYNTMSGYTLKYAQWLSEELGDCTLVPYKKFKVKMLEECDRVVFAARVANNTIVGFKTLTKYAEKFAAKYVSVLAVALTEPSAAFYHALEEANVPYILKGIPLFCVRGGFDADKLDAVTKLGAKITISRLMKASNRSPYEIALLNFYSVKSDFSGKEQLAPMLKYLESGVFTPPPKDENEKVKSVLADFLPKRA